MFGIDFEKKQCIQNVSYAHVFLFRMGTLLGGNYITDLISSCLLSFELSLSYNHMEVRPLSCLTSCAWCERAPGGAGPAGGTGAASRCLIGWCSVWAHQWCCPVCTAPWSRPSRAWQAWCSKRTHLITHREGNEERERGEEISWGRWRLSCFAW